MRSLLLTHPHQPLQAHQQAVFIVTTVFRDFSFIGSTLASVVGQEPCGLPLVYLIKDASPTNAGLAHVERQLAGLRPHPRSRLQVIYWHQPDGGLYAGLAEAFQHILSTNHHPRSLLSYLNADDRLEPMALQRICRVQAATCAPWLIGAPHMIDSHGRTLLRIRHALPYTQERIRLGHYLDGKQPFIQQEGSFWTLELFRRCRGFDPSLQLAGDYDLWLQLAAHCPPLCLSVSTGAFRQRPGQKSEDKQAYAREAAAVVAAAVPLLAAAPAASGQAFLAVDVDGNPTVVAATPADAPGGHDQPPLADPLQLEAPPAVTALPLPSGPLHSRRRKRDWRQRLPNLNQQQARATLAALGLTGSRWWIGRPHLPLHVRLHATSPGLQLLELQLLVATNQPTITLELRTASAERRITLNAPRPWRRQVLQRRLQLLEPLHGPQVLEIRCQQAEWLALAIEPRSQLLLAAGSWPYRAEPGPPVPAASTNADSGAGDDAVPIALLLDATKPGGDTALPLLLHHSLAALRQQRHRPLLVAVLSGDDPAIDAVLAAFSDDLAVQRLPAQPAVTALTVLLAPQPTAALLGWLQAGDRLAPGALTRLAAAHRRSGAALISGYWAPDGDSGPLEQPGPAATPLQPGWFWPRQLAARLLSTPQPSPWQQAPSLRLGATLVYGQPAAAARPQRPPRLLYLNDVGPCGGAGLAHSRLIQATQQHGASVLALHAANHWDPTGHPVGDWQQLERQLAVFAPDAIVCGNLHGLRTNHLQLLRQLAAAAPCFWITHDFWASNGHIPYPSLDARQPLPPANAATQRWQEQLSSIANLYLVANSAFSHRALAASPLAERLLADPLPLGFERSFNRLNFTAPTPPPACSGPLQLLVGSVGMDDPRKGAALLVAALEQLPVSTRQQLQVHSYGHTPIDALHGICPYHHLGYLDEAGIRAACSQAHLYVNPSLIETFGQVSVEALLAGAWLVSLHNGGVTDYASDGVNATLVAPDAAALSRGLAAAIARLRHQQDEGPDALEQLRNRQALSVDHYSLENSGLQLLRLTGLLQPEQGLRAEANGAAAVPWELLS